MIVYYEAAIHGTLFRIYNARTLSRPIPMYTTHCNSFYRWFQAIVVKIENYVRSAV